jgi:NAD(P)-dependent dehydrogenase (short-subunit alcohol dehydrogenase family)
VDDLNDRVALITGAGGGIGRALAATLAAEGMGLSLLDIDADALADTERAIVADHGKVAVRTAVVDVADAAAVAAAVSDTVDELGSLDLLCSNAGILRPGAVWEQPPQVWAQIMGVNLLGTVNLVGAAMPHMLARGAGHIVLTIGATALFTAPFSPPGSYAVSKHALLAYAETLFEELKVVEAPVGVTVLCPTGVRSAIAGAASATGADVQADGEVVRRPDIWRRVEALRTFISHGIDPAELAAMAVQAVRERRFWVFPDDSIPQRALHRADYIANATDPTAPPVGVSAALPPA